MLSPIVAILVLSLAGLVHADTPAMEIPRGYTEAEYRASVIDYWTPERMASAQPLQPRINTRNQVSWTKSAEDLEIERVLAADSVRPETRAATPPQVGRAFFNYGASRYWCSGSVVKSTNKDFVLTAGHCVYNTTTKQYATNWTFVPDYNYQVRPFGTFVARKLETNDEWKKSNDWNFDTAVALMLSDSNGKHIEELTGGFDLKLDVTAQTVVSSFGYPGNINNGETMSSCTVKSESGSILSLMPLLLVNDKRIKCGMGGGCSGGGWIQNHNPTTNTGQIIALNSLSYSPAPGYLYGPPLTTKNFGKLRSTNEKA